ncbi:MAG: sodium:calcium antiporter [Candidatus Hydrogenedentes bacterium]|nr:sodium:calcium antiporter [Candidatus Hydrogenedentota bacterium]
MPPLTQDILCVVAAIVILWKCADWFVEGAVAIAEKLAVPQMLVGLVIVSLATTSPELMASVLAALRGMPEVALGNAVGSVTVDAAVALGLAALVASTPLVAEPRLFRTSAVMLVCAIILAFVMCLDGVLARSDGLMLLALYVGYVVVSYMRVRRGRAAADELPFEPPDERLVQLSAGKTAACFGLGLAGVLGGSHLLLQGAVGIAGAAGVPPVVVGLTIVAVGTSMPEIATCLASALKKQSGIGVGNILGADILNLCWVAGMSAIANPLRAEMRVILVMFPAVAVIVGMMLIMLRWDYRLSRWNGAVLLALYIVYIAVLLAFSPREAPIPGIGPS